jgi:hypothetical protein
MSFCALAKLVSASARRLSSARRASCIKRTSFFHRSVEAS